MRQWNNETIFVGRIISVFFSMLIIFLFFPTNVFATSISPIRQTSIVSVGGNESFELNVTNDEQDDIVFLPEVDAFIIDSKTGTAIFGQEEEAVGWFNIIPSKLNLSPGESGKFIFEVNVPQTAEIYSRYLGLFARQESEGGQVGVGSRAGSLVFLHIAGPVYENLIKEEFKVDKKISLGKQVVVSLDFYNSGSIHLIPVGNIEIKNSKGKVLSRFPINIEQRKILPSGDWQAEYVLPAELFTNELGKITIDANILYGQTNKHLKLEQSFWYFPVWLLIGVGSGLLLIWVLCLIYKIRKAKRL